MDYMDQTNRRFRTIQDTVITLGTEVLHKPTNEIGIVQYIGTIQSKDGMWVGVSLDSEIGKTDGSIDGIEYFKTRKNYGSFWKLQDVTPCVFEDSFYPTTNPKNFYTSETINISPSIQSKLTSSTRTSVFPLKHSSNNSPDHYPLEDQMGDCKSCGKRIGNLGVEFNYNYYHLGCFKCATCHSVIRESDGFFVRDDKPNCISCSETKKVETEDRQVFRCHKCRKTVLNPIVLGRSYVTFWHPHCFRCYKYF